MTLDATSPRMSEPQDACNVAVALTTTSRKDAMANPIEDLPGEIWKPVVGYEGSYEVSNMGRVKSLSRDVRSGQGGRGWTRTVTRLRRPVKAQGYQAVGLHKDGCQRVSLVHRLVLEAFVGPCPDGMECCHADGCRDNPRLDNLRWDTHHGNVQDAVRHGTIGRLGQRNHYSKMKDGWVVSARERYALGTVEVCDLAAESGCGKTTIIKMLTGKTWAHLPGALPRLRQWYEQQNRRTKNA